MYNKMLRVFLFVAVFQFVFAVSVFAQTVGEIPNDIVVGGVSLMFVFNIVGKGLKNLAPESWRKFIPLILFVLGLVLGAVYSYLNPETDLLYGILSGISAALGAVGIHSTFKNVGEGLKQ